MLTSTLQYLCLIILISHKGSGVDIPYYLEPLTGDTYVFVGDDLKLTCTLSDEKHSSFTAHNTSFGVSISSKTGDSKVRCLLSSSIQEVSIQKAMLIVHNLTVNDAGMYNCYVGDSYCLHEGNILVGISEDVQVEYPPQNVTNFQCVVINWDEMIKCTWQHPVNYINWSHTNVSSGYSVVSKQPVTALRCPHQTNTGCEFKNVAFKLGDIVGVEVNVTNIIKETTACEVFKVETNNSVQPSPVEELTTFVDASRPECLVLSWNHPKKYWGKVYTIHQQIVGEHPFRLLADNYNSTTLTACGYLPYTHYNFSVECYPSQYSGYLSDPVFTDRWTLMTAPEVGPSITNGSYTTSKCIELKRNVTVMWREVKTSSRNGIIDGYIIMKEDDTILKIVTADVYEATLELSCSQPTTLRIFARNKGGQSLEPSILLISPSNITVPKSIKNSFSVELHKQNDPVTALWDVSKDAEIMNYTIFWCSNLLRQTCEGQISWITVPGTQADYNISVSSIDAQNWKYLFGISVTYSQPEMASEIFWTSCLFTRHPSKVKQTDWMDVDSGVESVKVMWSPVQCSYENQVKVTKYLVKLCQEQDCNDTRRIQLYEVPPTESFYQLSSLTANVRHKLTVQAVSYETEGQEFSPWKEAFPHAQESTNLIFLVLLVPFILVAIFGFILYRKCKSGQKKLQPMRERQIINFNNAHQYIPTNFSHDLSPTASENNILDEAEISYVVMAQASQSYVVMTEDRNFTDQENNDSGESFVDDPHINSRSRLIKSSVLKDCGKKSLKSHRACISAFNDPSLQQASEVLENIETFDHVQQNGTTPDSGSSDQNEQCQTSETDGQVDKHFQLNIGLPPNGSSVTMEVQGPTRRDSSQSYSHIAEMSSSNTPEEQMKAPFAAQNLMNTPHVNDCVLHANISGQEGLTIITKPEDINNVVQNEHQGIIQISTADTIMAVAPNASSVLGDESQDIEAASSGNIEDPSNLSPDHHISLNGAGKSDNSKSTPHKEENNKPNYVALTDIV